MKFAVRIFEKYLWRSSSLAKFKPATLLKMNFFTSVFQGFRLQISDTSLWLLLKNERRTCNPADTGRKLNIKKTFCTSYVCSIYVLCQRGSLLWKGAHAHFSERIYVRLKPIIYLLWGFLKAFCIAFNVKFLWFQ